MTQSEEEFKNSIEFLTKYITKMQFKEPIYELNNLIQTKNRQEGIEFYEAEYKCEIERIGANEVHYTTIRIRPELVKNILLNGTIKELYSNFGVR